MEENIENVNDQNGIVEVKYGNEVYKTWTVELIRPLITKFLKEKYLDSFIVNELNHIDITVFNNISKDIIPVEIQKTPIKSSGGFRHANFEDLIRRQIEDNIENYNICWFFFDSEYLRYLQSDNVGKNTSINMTWFIKLMKDETLKAFTIKYDGTVTGLTTKDFDFLKNVSQTCQIGYDNDERILNRNKLRIFHNVIKGYNFTQEEITQFENAFYNRMNKNIANHQFLKKSNNKKCILYGHILDTISRLLSINQLLCCNIKQNEELNVRYGVTLCLFEQNNFNGKSKHSRICFSDKYNIAQYFPGYIKNKELWDYCKNKQRVFTINDFSGLVTGTFNYDFIKKQSMLEDF